MRAKPAATSSVKRDRVFEIAKLMLLGEWGDGKDQTIRFAVEWDLSDKAISQMAAEASRLLSFTSNQREKLVALTRLRLCEIAELNGPDRVAALRTILEHMGELRRRVDVGGVANAPVHVTASVATPRLEPVEHFRALLRDPPPELEAVLADEWGPRAMLS